MIYLLFYNIYSLMKELKIPTIISTGRVELELFRTFENLYSPDIIHPVA